MMLERKPTRIKDIRRSELIAAAHRVFMRHGLNGLTTARICDEAGMSPGILAYYFKGKDEVLFAMVRHNNRLLMEDVALRMAAARSPWQRLVAVVEGNFPAGTFERDVAVAWLSVGAAAGANAGFARLQTIFYRRLSSNIASTLRQAIPAPDAGRLTLGLGAMIDGLWIRKAAGNEITRVEAIALLIDYLEAILPAAAKEAMKTSA